MGLSAIQSFTPCKSGRPQQHCLLPVKSSLVVISSLGVCYCFVGMTCRPMFELMAAAKVVPHPDKVRNAAQKDSLADVEHL